MKNEQAVALTPEDNRDRGMYLNNLGSALQRRFGRTGSMDDLNRATKFPKLHPLGTTTIAN